MRNLITTVVISSSLLLGGCGSKVEVPPAHIGKIMTKDGYKEGVVTTSKFRLPACMVYCDKIVTLDISDHTVAESMQLFMPRDKLNMDFDIRITLSVDPGSYNEIYSLVSPTNMGNDSIAIIPWEKVYTTYAQNIVRAEVREILSEFSIAEIASSRDAINAQLTKSLASTIEDKTPFRVRYLGLADVQYPAIILKAQENAAERREMIQQEEAQLEISKVQLERKLQEQKMNRAIEVEKAEADAQVNRILADSMTPEYVKYRSLQVLETMANSNNKVFLPMEMLSTTAGQVNLGNQ